MKYASMKNASAAIANQIGNAELKYDAKASTKSRQVYAIFGSDHALIVEHGHHRIERRFYTQRKLYGQRCRKVVDELAMPFNVVAAITPELAPELLSVAGLAAGKKGSLAERLRDVASPALVAKIRSLKGGDLAVVARWIG